jgi:hypothetical protein
MDGVVCAKATAFGEIRRRSRKRLVDRDRVDLLPQPLE